MSRPSRKPDFSLTIKHKRINHTTYDFYIKEGFIYWKDTKGEDSASLRENDNNIEWLNNDDEWVYHAEFQLPYRNWIAEQYLLGDRK